MRKEKLYVVLGVFFVLLFLAWLFRGYIWGYEVNIWFQQSVTKEEVEKRVKQLNGSHTECVVGKAFNTSNYMCATTLKGTHSEIKKVLEQLKSEQNIVRTDFLKDLIREYND